MAEDTTTPVEEKPIKTEAEAKATPKRKKAKRSVPIGQMHVLASFNNTIISFTDAKGGVLTTSSAGACGFRGSKKGTAYASQVASEKAALSAKQQYGLSKVDVFIKGIPGMHPPERYKSIRDAYAQQLIDRFRN